MSELSLGDIIGALITVALFITVGILAVGREPPKKQPRKPLGALHRFECTCGWHGWRDTLTPPISIQCPRCNGVAVQLRYRGDTQ